MVLDGKKGLIFDIERNAFVDGPGIRTVVFFKGCPLRCKWCHNPESQAAIPQLMYTKTFCIGCGSCLSACPKQAITATANGLQVNRDTCNLCGECVGVCYAKCWSIIGEWMSVEEVVEQVLKNSVYYQFSEGGVTISGGEPLFQAEFLINLLRRLKEEGINVALDTSGYATWETLKQVVPYTDLLLYDLKHLNSAVHMKLTSVPNELILDNLRSLVNMQKKVLIRIPIVPGLNDSADNIKSIASFIAEQVPKVEGVELLPFTRLGASKYQRLGLPNPCEGIATPPLDQMQKLSEYFSARNINVKIGG